MWVHWLTSSVVFVNRKQIGGEIYGKGDSESPDKTVKFADGDVLEVRSDEIPESSFTEQAKAEDDGQIITWVLKHKFSPHLLCFDEFPL